MEEIIKLLKQADEAQLRLIFLFIVELLRSKR